MDRNEDLRFTDFLRTKAEEAKRTLGYHPTYFLGMLANEGGYTTAIRLLAAKKTSDGFARLWESGRVDLSVEALVVESEWRHAFDPELLALAEKKLTAVGYRFNPHAA
jgi:hypothetical protein